MKFKPVEKMMQPRVANALRQHVPDAEGTAIYLELMNKMKESFMESTATPEERLFNVW